jgi:nucleotide-binding universal stress UspA family protein
LETILVALDGSSESAAAVDLSLRWARATGARLVGLGIVDEPTIRRPEPVPLGAGHYKRERDERRLDDARHRVEEFLHSFARRCAAEGLSSAVVEKVGFPHEQIALAAQRHDLVVIPRRSHFHFETEQGADDTVERVLRQSARPIVTVPERLPGSGPVIVAYDGGVHAAHALQAFVASGIEPGADVLVVTVDEDESAAAERAEGATAFLISHGIAGRRATVASRAAAPALLRLAQEAEARLLVAGHRQGRRLRDLVSTSVTRTLLRTAQVPMFLCS